MTSYTSVPQGNMAYATFTKNVNFNVATTDTLIPIIFPSGCVKYRVISCVLSGASHSLSTATVSLNGVAAGGAPVFAADQAITVTATAVNTLNNTQALTLEALAPLTAVNYANLYVYVGTPENAAATADVSVTVQFLG